MFVTEKVLLLLVISLTAQLFINSQRPSDTYICVNKLNTIGSGNGLAPGRRQAITWTNARILSIGHLATPQRNFNRNSSNSIKENAFQNIVWKMVVILTWPQCIKGLMALMCNILYIWSRYQWNIRYTLWHYSGVIMSAMASQVTGVSIVCSTVCSCTDQRKHQNSASLAYVKGIHRSPVDSLHKRPVPRKMFPCDDVIMSKTVTSLLIYVSLSQPL